MCEIETANSAAVAAVLRSVDSTVLYTTALDVSARSGALDYPHTPGERVYLVVTEAGIAFVEIDASAIIPATYRDVVALPGWIDVWEWRREFATRGPLVEAIDALRAAHRGSPEQRQQALAELQALATMLRSYDVWDAETYYADRIEAAGGNVLAAFGLTPDSTDAEVVAADPGRLIPTDVSPTCSGVALVDDVDAWLLQHRDDARSRRDRAEALRSTFRPVAGGVA